LPELLHHIRQARQRLPLVSAQGIVGAGPPQVAIGRLSGGTPAKPGFLRSKKCAQKPNIKVSTGFQPRMQAPFSYLTAEVETRFGYAGA
jgi:hypothetical protein